MVSRYTVGWDFERVVRRLTAATISIASILPPFALGLGLAVQLYPGHDTIAGVAVPFWPFALLLGTSLALTRSPSSPACCRRRGLAAPLLGAQMLTAAAVDDLVGWSVLASRWVNTPRTRGMNRAAATSAARAGADEALARNGHHPPRWQNWGASPRSVGECHLRRQRLARMRWGERLEFMAEATNGDSSTSRRSGCSRRSTPGRTPPLSCVVVRSGQEPVVVDIDLPAVEPNPEQIHWVDDIHREPLSLTVVIFRIPDPRL